MFSTRSKTILVALLLALACAPEGDDRATTPTDVAGGANRTDPPPQAPLPPVGGSSTGESTTGGSTSGDPSADEDNYQDPSTDAPPPVELPKAERTGAFRATCGKGTSARDEAVGCRITAASGLAADDRTISEVYALRAAGVVTKIEFKRIAGSEWAVVFALPEGEIEGYAIFHSAAGKDLARDDYTP